MQCNDSSVNPSTLSVNGKMEPCKAINLNFGLRFVDLHNSLKPFENEIVLL